MLFQPKFLATGIGSMPFIDPEHAIDVSLLRMPQAPIWPQLPQLGFREHMEIQYSEGMPCTVIDEEKGRMHFDTVKDYSEEFAVFYEAYMAAMDPDGGNGDCSAMAMSPEYSKGIYALLKRLKATEVHLPFIKVQTTGPCSFALTIVDQDKRAIYYNEEFRDMIVKALAMKCRWQIQKFKPLAERIICFIDEPILSAFGSSTYVSVKRDDIVGLLAEMISAIHSDSAVSGVHCCGNTEWSILIDAGIDIVNFDAFEFGDTILMYSDAVKKHLERGGMLAWGIVPTSLKIREQSIDGLVARLESMIDTLSAKGIDRYLIAQQAILTPSCGTGSMEPQDAEKVFEMLADLSLAMKKKYSF
jgi:hypothetical protein